MDGWDKGVSVQAGWVGRSTGRMHGGMGGDVWIGGMDVRWCWRAGEDGENRQTDKWITEWLRLGGVIKKITQLKPLCWGLVASPSSLAINVSEDEQDECNAALVSSMQKTEGLWGQRKGKPLLLLITRDGSGEPAAWSGGDTHLGRGRVFPSRVLQARTPRVSHPPEQGRSPQPQLGCEDGDPPRPHHQGRDGAAQPYETPENPSLASARCERCAKRAGRTAASVHGFSLLPPHSRQRYSPSSNRSPSATQLNRGCCRSCGSYGSPRAHVSILTTLECSGGSVRCCEHTPRGKEQPLVLPRNHTTPQSPIQGRRSWPTPFNSVLLEVRIPKVTPGYAHIGVK